MSIPAILAPVFAQVTLTFFLLFWLGRSRVAVLRAREVRMKDVALGQKAWPDRILQIGNAYNNQFETPVLFYALVALAILTRKADFWFVAMSWLYVLVRVVHAYIYTTSNVVSRRFQVFAAGTIVLMFMWLIFALRIFFEA
jgi:hypothetical protein